ncbi:NUDIX domain-containing protein [Aquibium sp. LZ166]|uniref:NUDIX domain-containing protein n=2 Tax=Aquibium pacificus TaxID=3153579 RepID=A0ABV3SD38_9HYPH
MTGPNEGASGRAVWPRIRGRLFHAYFLLRRPMTLGVRCIVYNEAERSVFLVRHTYVPGWHLPGGGVETGETLFEALAHELAEEGNIEMTGPPSLVAVYHNSLVSRRDHVALFLVTGFRQSSPKASDREIAEAGFFPVDRLPAGTTRATRDRLAEHFESRPPAHRW